MCAYLIRDQRGVELFQCQSLSDDKEVIDQFCSLGPSVVDVEKNGAYIFTVQICELAVWHIYNRFPH